MLYAKKLGFVFHLKFYESDQLAYHTTKTRKCESIGKNLEWVYNKLIKKMYVHLLQHWHIECI